MSNLTLVAVVVVALFFDFTNGFHDTANAVATVNAQQLAAVPATSLDQQLNGKLAGAYINNSSGAPGSTARITLRGITTINGSNTPQFVTTLVPRVPGVLPIIRKRPCSPCAPWMTSPPS